MSEKKRYFGTDGIRGVAGEAPLDAATVYAIGLALGDDLLRRGGQGAVVIGEDTRRSSRGIAAQLAAGLEARGLEVAHAGVLPTPGIAHLAARGGFRAGIVISASHNPYQDNGIKVFDAGGYKLPDEEEAEIENGIERYRGQAPGAPATLREQPELRAAYVSALAGRFRKVDFARLRLVLDCGHGAASSVIGPLCEALGIHAHLLAAAPDGRNINDGVGALYPAAMAEHVRRAGADAGVALDGDADRAILADASGHIITGDSVLLLAARELQAQGRLQPPIVVGTVMTNFGLETALAAQAIRLERSAVGDKYVLERMRACGAPLGGEPSGHVIFGGDATTGDGLLTALHCFALMAQKRQSLRALCQGWQALPQTVVNVRVAKKAPLATLADTQAAIRDAEREFAGRGRVLVRYSGTEMLARVMVEAPDAAAVQKHVHAIAVALQRDLAGANGERATYSGNSEMS
ncbi:MAG: phosphoglucosamine mutase [Terriglobales bacterium]